MKIAVDARTLGSRPSGVGMYLNDFLKQLMKYEDLEFVLISDVAESEYIKSFIKNGIKVYTKGKQDSTIRSTTRCASPCAMRTGWSWDRPSIMPGRTDRSARCSTGLFSPPGL